MFFVLFSLIASIEPTPDRASRIAHFECISVVRQIERMEESGVDIDQISSKVHELCNKFGENRKQVCETIANEKVKQVVELLKDKKFPQFVCDVIGYRRADEPERQISKSDCLTVVEKLKEQYKNFKPGLRRFLNRSHIEPPHAEEPKPHDEAEKPAQPAQNIKILSEEEEKKEKPKEHQKPFGLFPEHGIFDRRLRLPFNRTPYGLGPVCKEMPQESRMACHIISRFVFRALRHGQEEEPEQICNTLNETRYIKYV